MKCPKCGYEIPEYDDEEERNNKMVSLVKDTMKMNMEIHNA